MKRTYRTLNDCEMQHNAEVGPPTADYETVIISAKLLIDNPFKIVTISLVRDDCQYTDAHENRALQSIEKMLITRRINSKDRKKYF